MDFKNWVAKAATRSSLGTIAIALAMAVGGVVTSQPAHAQATGIKDTKHNLGSNGTGNKFSGTAEICVFCHTPHGADTSAAVPLWNRTLGLTGGATYQTYDSLGTTTLEGKTAPVGSVSIACLSCHDGTQAMSAVINAPGSGKTGDTTWTGGSWTGGTVVNGAIGTGGALASTAVTNLGTDLRNDHPIGIQYGGGGITATNNTTNDKDFKAPVKGGSATLPIWWVDTEAAGAATGLNTRQKTDMILYTRLPAATGVTNVGYTGQTVAEPFVECASCHDPHSTQSTFLRISNANSAVCLACHVK